MYIYVTLPNDRRRRVISHNNLQTFKQIELMEKIPYRVIEDREQSYAGNDPLPYYFKLLSKREKSMFHRVNIKFRAFIQYTRCEDR